MAFISNYGLQLNRSESINFTNQTHLRYIYAAFSLKPLKYTCCKNLFKSVPYYYLICFCIKYSSGFRKKPTGCAIKIHQLSFVPCTVPGDSISNFIPDSNSWVFLVSNEVSFVGEFCSKGGQKSQSLKLVTRVHVHKCWWLQVTIGSFCIFLTF